MIEEAFPGESGRQEFEAKVTALLKEAEQREREQESRQPDGSPDLREIVRTTTAMDAHQSCVEGAHLEDAEFTPSKGPISATAIPIPPVSF
ncbi:MAG: hypothetical protein ABSA72_13090 [Nitrososphaerales archaeon]